MCTKFNKMYKSIVYLRSMGAFACVFCRQRTTDTAKTQMHSPKPRPIAMLLLLLLCHRDLGKYYKSNTQYSVKLSFNNNK